MSVPNRRAATTARPYSIAGALAIGYALFGVAWILFSDHLLLTLAPDMRALAVLGQSKGLAFVLATSAALFWLTRRRERQVEDTHRQWAMAFENTRDGVMIADADGRILAINRAFTQITGYTEDDALGQTARLLQSGMHDAGFYRSLWRALRDHGHWQGEIWNRRKGGDIYPEWLTVSAVRDAAGVLTHYVGVFTDITRVKHSEAQLDHLAHYDPLTGLPNRSLLHTRLEQTLARAARHRSKAAVLYIDLDGFKTVNDSRGHPVGDELLLCISRRLRARLREEDLLGRLGGDEFLVVVELPGGPAEVAGLARDLLATVAEPVPLPGGGDAYITASIGISVFPDDASSNAVEMLRDADAAMYRAKDMGRNRFCFYTSDMNAEAMAKLELDAALSRALDRNEFLLHYQPKVEALSGRIVGAEALLRWQRGGVGLVSPGQFIPIAERSSMILGIGAWVIDEVCRQIRQWMDAGQPVLRIAVNVAARQFAAGDLDLVLGQALRRHGVPADCIEVELTESMLMERPEVTAAMLHKLKALGVKLSLDDFGTGYSSLGYLHSFPIDTLKIDQSFVRGIGSGDQAPVLVDAIIALAHRLKLSVVAEGVETARQRDYLLQQGCDELQGYHFGRPDTAEALQLRLAAQAQPAATPQLTQ
ncbi:MAG: EAL domain-containing protein [Burkholderiaceae bacterium]|nr:EAL domain-containing protein [Burkholderiaceae bacterium]